MNSFTNIFFSFFQPKSIKAVTKEVAKGKKFRKNAKKNLVKLSYSAQKLQFQTILFPYKLCVTEKRTYVTNLKSLSSYGFDANTPQ